MREIEFRAWEPDLKKYYFFDLYTLYCINPDKIKIPKADEDNAMVLFNINHRPFEQYTGLRDKNGQKIYEGDLVKSDWDDSISQIMFGEFNLDNDMSNECTIVGFYWGNEENNYICGFGLDCNGETNKYTVMGNIHKNPELLNG